MLSALSRLLPPQFAPAAACVTEYPAAQAHPREYTRRDHRRPIGAWITEQARHLLTSLGDRAEQFRFLIRDRDGKFYPAFDAVFADADIRPLRRDPLGGHLHEYVHVA
jgi:hypothetical protein